MIGDSKFSKLYQNAYNYTTSSGNNKYGVDTLYGVEGEGGTSYYDNSTSAKDLQFAKDKSEFKFQNTDVADSLSYTDAINKYPEAEHWSDAGQIVQDEFLNQFGHLPNSKGLFKYLKKNRLNTGGYRTLK